MELQWMFWAPLLALLTNALVSLAIWAINRNTFKVNAIIGIATLCLFVGWWIYTANNLASWTPAWIAAGILFWVGWRRIQKAGEIWEGPGQAVIPGPDFFNGCVTVRVLSCEQFWDYACPEQNPDHETMSSSCEVFESHYIHTLLIQMNGDYSTVSKLRLIQHHRPISPGYYTPAWENGGWELTPTFKATTH